MSSLSVIWTEIGKLMELRMQLKLRTSTSGALNRTVKIFASLLISPNCSIRKIFLRIKIMFLLNYHSCPPLKLTIIKPRSLILDPACWCVNQVSIVCLSVQQILHWSLKRANHVHHSKTIFFIWAPCWGKHKPVQQKGLNNHDWLACSTLTQQKHRWNPRFLEKLHRWYIVWMRCNPECKQGRSINTITPENSKVKYFLGLALEQPESITLNPRIWNSDYKAVFSDVKCWKNNIYAMDQPQNIFPT